MAATPCANSDCKTKARMHWNGNRLATVGPRMLSDVTGSTESRTQARSVDILPACRRWVSLVSALVFVIGCATRSSEGGPPAPAPTYRVGDRWVYQASDGFRAPTTWVETHEVVSVDSTGIVVRVT